MSKVPLVSASKHNYYINVLENILESSVSYFIVRAKEGRGGENKSKTHVCLQTKISGS